MTLSTHLKLPFILPAQAQKHISHNEAIAALDTLAQLAVLDRDLNAPPGSPVAGARYIVGTAPTGLWSGKSRQVAAWDGADWLFHAPEPGWQAFLLDENGLVVWSGTAWLPTLGLGGAMPLLGVNATADTTNRLSVKSDAVLLSHDDVTPGSGDQRLTLNKSATAKSASLVLQTGFSGRAEIGTAGDDKLHVKVSSDGSAWHDAVVVDPATRYVGIGTNAPEAPLHILRSNINPLNDRVDDNVAAPTMTSRKARGSVGAKTAVLAGDVVQAFFGQGYDGAAYVGCANMRWVVEGSPASGSLPSRLEFWTFTAGVGLSEKMRVDSAGNVGLGLAAPAVKLDVDGPVRVKSYTVSALPAAGAGAGQIIFVSNEAGGATLAFSDGTNWRRDADRAVVT